VNVLVLSENAVYRPVESRVVVVSTSLLCHCRFDETKRSVMLSRPAPSRQILLFSQTNGLHDLYQGRPSKVKASYYQGQGHGIKVKAKTERIKLTTQT